MTVLGEEIEELLWEVRILLFVGKCKDEKDLYCFGLSRGVVFTEVCVVGVRVVFVD